MVSVTNFEDIYYTVHRLLTPSKGQHNVNVWTGKKNEHNWNFHLSNIIYIHIVATNLGRKYINLSILLTVSLVIAFLCLVLTEELARIRFCLT